jgi:hypothetical protein
VFKKFRGPIPPGHDVDHMCAAWSPDILACRKCVNPDHLQAILPVLNQQLKLLRRMGYGTEEMDLAIGHHYETLGRPNEVPILAPGESIKDFIV